AGYGAFRKCLWSALRWMREEGLAGREVAPGDAGRVLAERWSIDGPPDSHPHASLLRDRAEAMLRAACEHADNQGLKARQEAEIVAELDNGRIRIRLDALGETEDGRLVVERHHTGRARNDDHTAPRLALFRRAARQT